LCDVRFNLFWEKRGEEGRMGGRRDLNNTKNGRMILEDVGCLVSAVIARPGEKGVPYSIPYMAGEPVSLGFSVFREAEGAQQEVQEENGAEEQRQAANM
jgi:hypothetical protein